VGWIFFVGSHRGEVDLDFFFNGRLFMCSFMRLSAFDCFFLSSIFQRMKSIHICFAFFV